MQSVVIVSYCSRGPAQVSFLDDERFLEENSKGGLRHATSRSKNLDFFFQAPRSLSPQCHF